MLIGAGLVLLFLYWIISPFLPKDKGAPVIHNNIHIVNNPVNNNTAYSTGAREERTEQPSTTSQNELDRIFRNRY